MSGLHIGLHFRRSLTDFLRDSSPLLFCGTIFASETESPVDSCAARLFIVEMLKHLGRPISRRRFLGLTSVGLPASAGLSYGYGAVMERHSFEVTRPRVAVDLGPLAPRKVRVALLSDFHYDPLFEIDYFKACVDRVNQERPDVVLLLGDYITEDNTRVAELAGVLGQLQPSYGTYGILGNHDVWDDFNRIQNALTQEGITVLRNHTVRVPMKDGTLALGGLDSAWGGDPDPATLQTEPGEKLLLAMHEPDFIDYMPSEVTQRVALQVSGHTHGGQICAPLGIVLRRASWGHRYTRGLYRVRGGGSGEPKVYVNRGLGTINIHARFWCRPEITMMELVNRNVA